MSTPPDARRAGLRLLHGALSALGVFALAAVGWVVVQAVRNPDVRARRPGWLAETIGFDVAFWTPLLLTVAVGVGAVGYVFWRAFRRLRAGEDLYANRLGRGQRRRGERFLEEPAPPEA